LAANFFWRGLPVDAVVAAGVLDDEVLPGAKAVAQVEDTAKFTTHNYRLYYVTPKNPPNFGLRA
jgi:hypothetical protein